MEHLAVMTINLDRVRANARQIKKHTEVALFPTLKADAYGLGARRVVEALNGIADSYCVFSLAEALALRQHVPLATSIRTMGPASPTDTSAYRSANVIPCITSVAEARGLRGQPTLICVDTGFGRLAAPLEILPELLALSGSAEVMTSIVDETSLELFHHATDGLNLFRHAAASEQLHDPRAFFDAVRPGLALYDGAVRVIAPVHEISRPSRMAGYGRFAAERFGVILIGYDQGLRPGPCLVGGKPSTVLEVGMQSACVSLSPDDGVGAEVTLLGDSITPELLADAWRCRPHEVLTSLGRVRRKDYLPATDSASGRGR